MQVLPLLLAEHNQALAQAKTGHCEFSSTNFHFLISEEKHLFSTLINLFMKSFLTLLFSLGLASALFGRTQNACPPASQNGAHRRTEDLRRPFILKLSPFHLFDNTLHLGGETFLNKTYKSSIYLGLGGTYADKKLKSDIGGSVDLQFRYYPRTFHIDSSSSLQSAASGLFIGFGITCGINELRKKDNGQFYSDSYDITSQWITPSVVLGYQIIQWESLFVDVFIGGGMRITNVTYTASSPSFENDVLSNGNLYSRYFKGVLPKAGLTIGLGF
jgi:hypothetical protein